MPPYIWTEKSHGQAAFIKRLLTVAYIIAA